MGSHDHEWSQAECDTLDALLDVLVPPSPDGKLPGAGQLGVRDYLRERCDDTVGAGEAITGVLRQAMQHLADAGVVSLGDVPAAERVAFVQRLEAAQPLHFVKFTNNAYLGYYTHPTIPPHYGLPDRPPQPLGHEVAADDDLDVLLEPVRRRGKVYREV